MNKSQKAMGEAVDTLLAACEEYAQLHEQMYASPIGEDYVIGDAVRQIMRGIDTLLNGELGLRDGGELSKRLYALAVKAGLADKNGEF